MTFRVRTLNAIVDRILALVVGALGLLAWFTYGQPTSFGGLLLLAEGVLGTGYGLGLLPSPARVGHAALQYRRQRRSRRLREWIDRQNALNQDRELRELLTGEPQPVVRAKLPMSGFALAKNVLIIAVAALFVAAIVGILVIAALHGFRPSGS